MDKNREVDNGGVYLPAGCMVPEYGRLALLEGLDMVGERVLMCDTDSIIYMASQNESENIPEGDLLGFLYLIIGDWEEEKISKGKIVEFVGFGPKCYSIKTLNHVTIPMLEGHEIIEKETKTLLKGISQTVRTQQIGHEYMVNEMTKYLETGVVSKIDVPQISFKGNPIKACGIRPVEYPKVFKLMDEDTLKGVREHLSGGGLGSKVYPRGWDFARRAF
jgi:hypothetical protein